MILLIIYILGVVGMIVFVTWLDCKTEEFELLDYPEMAVSYFLLVVLWPLFLGWVYRMRKKYKICKKLKKRRRNNV